MKKGLFLLLWFFGCATVAQYVITVDPFPTPREAPSGREVLVTEFVDARRVDTPQLIGRKGDKGVPLLLSLTPSTLLSREVRDFLLREGFQVKGEAPSWDLSPEGLDPSWGDLVVGGRLERLWIEVGGGLAPRCKVQIEVSFAIAREGKVERRRVEVEEERRLSGFDEEKLSRLLGTLLAEAIRRGLYDLPQ
ncbi:MAG: hypothetical protein DRG33_05725 [Deltaproteobacteria bacterium]|nr:MAG: hypothetical protein DRG33_05725 [Deltaproteobacteria bacterium]